MCQSSPLRLRVRQAVSCTTSQIAFSPINPSLPPHCRSWSRPFSGDNIPPHQSANGDSPNEGRDPCIIVLAGLHGLAHCETLDLGFFSLTHHHLLSHDRPIDCGARVVAAVRPSYPYTGACRLFLPSIFYHWCLAGCLSLVSPFALLGSWTFTTIPPSWEDLAGLPFLRHRKHIFPGSEIGEYILRLLTSSSLHPSWSLTVLLPSTRV
jgi:hypothetical protein